MKINILVLLFSLVLYSCSSGNEDYFATKIFNSSVASSLVNSDKELNVARTVLVFETGNKVTNCVDYEKEIKKSKISEAVNNQLVKSEYLVCGVLTLLAGRPYSIVSADTDMSNMLAEKLDLRSIRSSLGPRLDEKNYTLKSIAGNDLTIENNKVVYETGDWIYRIELIAISDVNNNDKEDWVVWFIDESKIGNYRGYQSLVLYDIDMSQKIITAQNM